MSIQENAIGVRLHCRHILVGLLPQNASKALQGILRRRHMTPITKVEKTELTTFHKTHRNQLELADMARLVRKYPDEALNVLFRRYDHGEDWVHETCHEIEKNFLHQRVNWPRTIHHIQGSPAGAKGGQSYIGIASR